MLTVLFDNEIDIGIDTGKTAIKCQQIQNETAIFMYKNCWILIPNYTEICSQMSKQRSN